ncbi:MAG: amino acid racemase [Gammaproteobacteria bacterium]
MKTIGFLGGTGWVSSVEYYRYLNQGINEQLGGLSSARIFMHSVNFAELNTLKEQGPDNVFAYLERNLSKLIDAGADFVMLGANTLHIHAEKLTAKLPVPLLHIADATAEAIKARGLRKVGLLGTRVTMEKDFYKNRLAQKGIQVLVPGKEERDFIDHVIWHELEKIENNLDEAYAELRELITHFRAPVDKRGLVPGVQYLVNRFRNQTGIHIYLQQEWNIVQLPASFEVEVLRIARS